MRVSFLVDGFNLYHSFARFKKKTTQASLSRCQFLLPGKRRELRLPYSRILVAVKGFEEKETDVAIAVKMLELAHSGRIVLKPPSW